ncbi:MAG: hypothetical protein QXN15_06860 [Candidatus Jordarchaeales archaeon]|nr:hypothetical protein [Candidatus Jordarchaeia archaeon]
MGVIIHVWGEAGSGKTALAARVSSSLSEKGFHVIYVSDRPPRGVWGDVERVTFLIVSEACALASLPDMIERLVNPRTRLVVIDTVAGLFRHLARTAKLRLLPLTCLRLRRLAAERGVSSLLLNEVATLGGEEKPWEGSELDRYVDFTVRLRKDDGKLIVEGASLSRFLPGEALDALEVGA